MQHRSPHARRWLVIRAGALPTMSMAVLEPGSPQQGGPQRRLRCCPCINDRPFTSRGRLAAAAPGRGWTAALRLLGSVRWLGDGDLQLL